MICCVFWRRWLVLVILCFIEDCICPHSKDLTLHVLNERDFVVYKKPLIYCFYRRRKLGNCVDLLRFKPSNLLEF